MGRSLIMLLAAMAPAWGEIVVASFSGGCSYAGGCDHPVVPGFHSAGLPGTLKAVRIGSEGGAFADLSATNDTQDFKELFARVRVSYSIADLDPFFFASEGVFLLLGPGESDAAFSGTSAGGFAEFTLPQELKLFLPDQLQVRRTGGFSVGTAGLTDVSADLSYVLNGFVEYEYDPVPESGSYALVLFGLAALLSVHLRK